MLNPSGTGYYAELGIVGAKDAGWLDEKITDGIVKLSTLPDGGFDIFFVDTRKEIISARQDGGEVQLLNRGKNVISILVVYPGQTAEVYSFFKTTSGKLEYTLTLSRTGDAVLIAKSSVMKGTCEYINFDSLP